MVVVSAAALVALLRQFSRVACKMGTNKQGSRNYRRSISLSPVQSGDLQQALVSRLRRHAMRHQRFAFEGGTAEKTPQESFLQETD